MSKTYLRGDLYYADLGHGIGSEQKGTRPVVIIQNNVGNKHSPTVIIAAVTSKANVKAKLPTHYYLDAGNGLVQPSLVLLEQIRTVDKRRLSGYIGRLDEEHIRGINHALAISIGLIEPVPPKLTLCLCDACADAFRGTGAFVLSVENMTVVNGKAVPSPDVRLKLDYDPAPCILPLRVERSVVTEAAFVSECLMDGKPAIYLQTHTGNEKKRTIHNEWFRVTDSMSGTPVFSPVEKPPEGTVESVTVEGSPPWFALFSPGAVKNIDGGSGLGMSVFAEALEEAQGVDLAFDNYREDIRLGHKKIFYSADICRKVVDDKGVEHSIPPDDDVVSQFVHLPGKESSLDQPNEYHEYNPDLRVEQNHRAVQDMLNLFSFKCGLGCHRYDFENGKVTTATEYNGSRQDLVASANKNQIPIEGSVNWDDSYITDAETRMTQMRDDALSGLLPRYKYLSARYGISEEDARRLAQEAKDESRQPELAFGGGA